MIRRQLTLFVNHSEAKIIENVRRKFNPKQFQLIKSHITLCREDEIENLEKVTENLQTLNLTEFDIVFGKIRRFDEGKGLLLPALPLYQEFDNLRRRVLRGWIDKPRKHEPHITLMHPRNSTCTDHIFTQIEKINFPTKLNFKTISLIEQENGGHWHILKEFHLLNKK